MNPRYIAQQLIPILFEDDHFLVIPKPAGVEVAARRELPGTGLTDIIAAVRGRSETLDAVNRLGRWESGILLLAKDREALRTLRGDLRSNRILHTYLAVVVGRPAMRRTLIDASHGSSRGRRHGARDQDKRRTGIGPAHDKRRETRRPRRDAVIPPTEVRVLRSVATRSLVHVRTTSASAHVVRAQLRAAGLRLLDRRGRAPDPRRRPTGSDFLHLERLSWHHPHRRSDRVINSAPAPGFAAALKGETDVQRSLTAALVRRLPLIIESGTDSFRLITGNVEDMEGLVAEKYGRFIVLQVREKRLGAKRWVMEIARWYRRTLASEAVYVKQITRGETASDEAALAALRSPEPLLGATLPQETQIHELGLNYLVRPYDGASVGLYLDHRDNRRRVRSLAKNKDVLNLFSYTCSFSVAAAAGGAASVTSVDISPKSLEWGLANMRLNGLDSAANSFIASDVSNYLRQARRRNERFDLIIIDPPTFAHGRRRGRSFSVLRDLPELICGAVTVLRPGGTIMLSTNHRRVSAANLRAHLDEGAGSRSYQVIAAPTLPLDFAADPDHAKTIFARFD